MLLLLHPECAWQQAADDQGCVPWFLREKFDRAKYVICDAFENRRFRMAVGTRHKDSKRAPCYKECLPGE